MNVVRTRAAFGQRGREVGPSITPAGGTARPKRALRRIACLASSAALLLSVAGALFWIFPAITQLGAETTQAEESVSKIVNQPITHLHRFGPMKMFSPGWFHTGAIKPDFNTVDIRATQELLYQGNVSSDLNPTEMFVGSDLEFNKMTKYFYADLTLPKKRLSESEMIEINGLYREIGRTEQAIFVRWLEMIGLFVVALCLGYAVFLTSRRVPAL